MKAPILLPLVGRHTTRRLAQDLVYGHLNRIQSSRRLEREAQRNVELMWLTYLFGLSDGTTIDGAEGGNATRHLNHACEPNCEAQEEHGEGGQLVLRIEAIRHIRAGEELFIDYALNVDADADPQDYSCRCGSIRCRGTLLATPA